MNSRFLPADFDPKQACIGIIAGKGRYPQLVRDAALIAGVRCVLIGFDGETEANFIDQFNADSRLVVKVGQVGKTARGLKHLGATHAMMAGQISPKRLFKGLHPDITALQILARLKERNAQSIFSAIGDEIEKLDIAMLDGRALLDSHLASEGLMTGGMRFHARDDLAFGIRMAKEIARLDIGQGVVVHNGTVLAVEAFEGTDAMLRRAGTFETKQPLFVKTVKPGQDYRYDVPAFGLRTIQTLHDAHIRHVALEADRTLMIDKTAVLAAAAEARIQIFGYQTTSS